MTASGGMLSYSPRAAPPVKCELTSAGPRCRLVGANRRRSQIRSVQHMAHVPLPIHRGFGETMRRDAWWVQPLVVFVILSSFLVYATWAAFQNAHYTWGPYLSPFYSPELLGDSPHAVFGPKPAAWPGWLPFSPALLILPFPALFRFTCYYYRGAYYKAFWADPPNCSVGEPRSNYRGENSFPLIIQNIHRYFLYFALAFL